MAWAFTTGCAAAGGAEQDALRAIKLCVDAGFPTRVQMNINRKNRDSILLSLALLDDMGVGRKSSLTRRQGGFRICMALKHWSSLLDQYAPNAVVPCER